MKYFVYYSFNGGEGNTEVTVPNGIESFKDIEIAQKAIGDKFNQTSVFIKNYIKFKGE